MKKLIYYILFISLFAATATGCKKFLDRKPLGNATAGDLNVGGLEGLVFGLYGKLRSNGISGFETVFAKSVRSDDALKGSISTDQPIEEQVFEYFHYENGKKGFAETIWNDHFNFIYSCNEVIYQVDSLKLSDAGSLSNKAEASFMRAYSYFDLVRDFGEVPIIERRIYAPGDAIKAKSTVDEVYAFIQKDLEFAAANLPESWNGQFPGRVTKGTANSLLAKMFLYKKNWATALSKAEEVINSGQYSLLPNYFDYFKESGENSSESIFEVQLYVSANGSISYNNNYNESQGVRGSGDWDLGWGFNVPNTTLIDAYEPGDTRKNGTVLVSGEPDGVYGLTLPASPPLSQKYWNKKVYSDPARRLAANLNKANWLNVRLLRYADVLLIAAEAANESGNSAKAIDYLELVRARARGGAAVLPKVTTTDQAALRAAIKHERRVEFGMEFERFYDLVRWGDAVTVLAPWGYQNRHRYLPVPQAAIDRSGGVLIQNPDWQ